MARQWRALEGPSDRTLWFSPPIDEDERRPVLTRERLVIEALALVNAEGVDGLTMRALAGRLGVVPGALYRHVRSKEQLHDLVLDGVLAEVDLGVDEAVDWIEQIRTLAQRLRVVLEDHPGIAGLLKVRDPLSPHSLALAEGFLAALQAGGLPDDQTALAFRLIYDYTLGFALGDGTSASEQRLQDAKTRGELASFLRSLPADRFPVLTALGERVWVADRDTRFTASLNTLINGLQADAGPRPRRRA